VAPRRPPLVRIPYEIILSNPMSAELLTGYARYDLKCVIPFTGPFWAFTHRSAEFVVNWPRGGSREGTLASPGEPLMHVANRGAGGIFRVPIVHL
jgi:hypothetical protein